MTSRIALIGDIGGHLDVFTSVLAALNVDLTATLVPDDLIIIQVGDLVHKGPRSDECVALADHLLRRNPDRYLQLWGNHDATYVGGPDVTTRPGVISIGDVAQATLRAWYVEGLARLAVALETTELGPVLITHSGLTEGLWEEIGSPRDATIAASRLNELLINPSMAFRPGWLMTRVYDRSAGVTCARTGAELAGPWLEAGVMPFSQVHGHEGVWWWPANDFHDDVPAPVRGASHVDQDARWCWVEIADHRLWSIDWVLGTTPPARPWVPLILTGLVN